MSYPSGPTNPFEKPPPAMPAPPTGYEPLPGTGPDPWRSSYDEKRTGRSFPWGFCLLGCLGMFLIGILVCAGVGYYAARKIPDGIRDVTVAAVRQSDLAEEDKRVIIEQIHRVHGEYKAGRIGIEKVGEVVDRLTNSPLIPVMIAKAAKHKYLNPSGLTDEEKAAADVTLQRVARGVIENKIESHELDLALDYISTRQGEQRQFKETVSDDDLRKFLEECRRLVDAKEIPDEPFQIDLGSEFRKAVDQALGAQRAESDLE